MTFDDEFNGSSLDAAKWNYGWSGLPWCSTANCTPAIAGNSVANGVLSQTVDPSSTRNQTAINTAGHFSQRFGYFVWRSKLPTNVNGEGDHLWPADWFTAIGKTGFPGGCQDGNEEMDLLEVLGLPRGVATQVTATIHDYCANAYHVNYPNTGINLAAGFHDYGLLWVNDGSPHGTMSIYFDGTKYGSHTLDARAVLWDNGVQLIVQMQPCYGASGLGPCPGSASSNNPFQTDFVRAYQAVAN